jgi:hypothetical protein
MTRIRTAPDGTVRALWTDEIDWRSLGRLKVERASHVEFCRRRQLWFVRAGTPRAAWRRVLQWVLRRQFGEIECRTPSREEALAWERERFGPGGLGWSPS